MTSLVGTADLVRFIVRRDRIRIPAWFGLTALFAIGVLASVQGVYPTEAARLSFFQTTNGNPAQLMMIGPIFDASEAGIGAWRIRGQVALLLSLASLLLVVRHTRAEEESGRDELMRSTVVGRYAGLTAALLVAFAANLGAAVVMTLGFVAQGLAVGGSIALALSFAAAGCVAAALAALAAQLTASSRAAIGLATAGVGVCYAIRAIADAGDASWLRWLSPFGWTQEMRPFAGNHWWPLPLVAGLVALLVVVAYAVSARRDLGAGILPARLGPATAAPRLRSALALAWRLQRGVLIAWTVGGAAFGAAIGTTADTIAEQVDESQALGDLMAQMGGGGRPVDGFFGLIIYLVSQVVTIYAIQATLRMRAEELSARADTVLSGPVSRLRWAGGHLLVAAAGTVVVMTGLGFGMGLVYGLATGGVGGELPPLLAAAVVRAPSVLVLAAIAAALYGIAPRFAAPVAYAVLGLCFLLELAVAYGGASESLMWISPFAQTPALPSADFAVVPLLWFAVIAGGLVTAGMVGLRRRDLG
ncbi:ABC-2 type transport system permease protein [Kibdelosporangium banguiense]|uniref:ABC-2 type transport system permease protein n=1 Tax=Kibdelosporangium banguiense TaxID=1365924 RepID=A0ABS4TVG0_9PSEU|nr:ABC transporter permease [Kibdelosporangium banguiense]MBP2327938.1 ABC-2 type transport system permease protein [Kibdelosporangium banguiense]